MLAMAQINFASRFKHPALKCIAPWEAVTDVYKHVCTRGGMPHIPSFMQLIDRGFAGTLIRMMGEVTTELISSWALLCLPIRPGGTRKSEQLGFYSAAIRRLLGKQKSRAGEYRCPHLYFGFLFVGILPNRRGGFLQAEGLLFGISGPNYILAARLKLSSE